MLLLKGGGKKTQNNWEMKPMSYKVQVRGFSVLLLFKPKKRSKKTVTVPK